METGTRNQHVLQQEAYVIRKTKSGYKVVSHQTGKSFGTYKTKSAAQARLRQIKRFKGKK